jgi:hypothetical protein
VSLDFADVTAELRDKSTEELAFYLEERGAGRKSQRLEPP